MAKDGAVGAHLDSSILKDLQRCDIERRLVKTCCGRKLWTLALQHLCPALINRGQHHCILCHLSGGVYCTESFCCYSFISYFACTSFQATTRIVQSRIPTGFPNARNLQHRRHARSLVQHTTSRRSLRQRYSRQSICHRISIS